MHIRGGERSFPYGLAIFWLDCKLFSGKLPALAAVLKAKKVFAPVGLLKTFGNFDLCNLGRILRCPLTTKKLLCTFYENPSKVPLIGVGEGINKLL